jgi:uncharacterized protein DUF6335
MANAKRPRRAARAGAARKRSAARSSGKRPKAKARVKRAAAPKAGRKKARVARKKSTARRPKKAAKPRASARPAAQSALPAKRPSLDRVRRTLDETVPGPPSSLDMDRRGSAARTGRAELADNRKKHGSITPGITGGDVDVNYENAYFSGDEAPGGDNPTPDQEVVDDIGKALGVEYNDNEELKSSDKLTDRDKHRWELDPASSEDYKDRD